MVPNLLFTMSLAGSTVFLLYILAYPFAKKYFSLKWRYGILKIAAAFYLLPVPVYKYLIIDVIYRFFRGRGWENNRRISGMIDMEYIIIIGRDFVEFSSGVSRMLLVVLLSGIISFAIIQRRMIRYWKWKRVRSVNSEKPSDREQELFTKVKKETGIKKDVKFICSEYCRSPMASGILSPVLIFPIWRDRMEADKYEYMLRHELVHIKHHDLFIKYIGLLVISVHWYNPLVYVMFHEISVISEMYCDSIVISGKGEEERRKYSSLILTLATRNEYAGKEKFFVGMADSRSKNVYKRRVLEMKRHTQHKAVLSVIMTVMIGMAGVVTTFAYDSPNTVSGLVDHDVGGDAIFIIEPEEAGNTELPSDHFFADDSGIIIEGKESNEKKLWFN
uniref:Peptidase M56 domain-containing protein n=1 Tax=Eubacterium plexicaudatum ASF492 TaxID=1235802 RepID=N2AC46_9FIRM